jgi:predicted aspartyl protease
MGLTHIEASIANPARPQRRVRLSLLVDSGAVYSVVPASLLRKLGIKPHSRHTFTLADGTRITRRVGDVLFRLDGRQGASPVIFGGRDAGPPWATARAASTGAGQLLQLVWSAAKSA